MKNKKGFTLMELLFVMVLLAIIVIAVYPKILNYYNDARKSSFYTNVKSALKSSNSKFQTESMKNNIIYVFEYDGENTLDLSSDLKYCINLNEKGEVEYAKVSNGSYYVEGNEETFSTSSSEIVKYGDFSKFDCNYVLDEKDVYDQKEITGMTTEERKKILKYLGIAFVVTLILAIVTKRTNER